MTTNAANRPAGYPGTRSADRHAPIDAHVADAGTWSFGGRAVLLLANLFATPFLIRLLGPASYGLWTILLLATTWASNADLAMGAASTKVGAGYYSRGDPQGESSVVWTALGLIAVTTGCAATTIALAAHVVLASLLHVEKGLLDAGLIALRIGCAVFVLQSVAAIVNTPQAVRLKWRQWTVFTTSVNLLCAFAAPLALAVFRGGIATVATVALVSSVLLVAGNLFLGVRLQPALRRPRFSRAILRTLIAYGGPLTVAGVALVPLSTAERFFLAQNHSTVAVAYFAVAVNLATTLQVLPEQMTAPLLPGFARLRAAGRNEDLRVLYEKGLVGLFLLVTPVAVLLAFVARPFLSLWAGPQYGAHSTAPFLIALAGVWLDCLAWMPNSYLLSSGRTRLIAWIKVVELAPYLVAAWILTQHLGVIGAAIAWSASCALDSVLSFLVVGRVAPLPWLPLSGRQVRSLAGPLALSGAAILLAHVTSGLTVRLTWSAVLAVAYGAAEWYVILTSRERQGIRTLARHLRGAQQPAQASGNAARRYSFFQHSRAPHPTRTRVSPQRPGSGSTAG